MAKFVQYEIKKHTAMIILNRPEARNLLNQELLIQLYKCIDEVVQNSKIHVAILTGSGSAFCSGLDILARRKENVYDPRGDGKDLPAVFANCKKPIIGAINGRAISAGLELALHCDFLIGSERASFADTHARTKVHPAWGMTQLLQEAVGRRLAKQISFTGEFLYAEKAYQWGLLNELVPHAQLIPRAMEIAESISTANQEMLNAVKEMIEYRSMATQQVAMAHERFGFKKFVQKHLKQ